MMCYKIFKDGSFFQTEYIHGGWSAFHHLTDSGGGLADRQSADRRSDRYPGLQSSQVRPPK